MLYLGMYYTFLYKEVTKMEIGNNYTLRIIFGDLKSEVTGSVAKIAQIKELLIKLEAQCINSTNTFELSRQQYAEFCAMSVSILYN